MRVRGSYTLSAPDLQTLRNAGFSADFVAFLQALRPQQRLTNASIIAMGQKRLPADEMLREIRNAERAFDTSPRALLALAKNHQVPAEYSGLCRGSRSALRRSGAGRQRRFRATATALTGHCGRCRCGAVV